jgi:hypothetical protein
MAAESAVSPSSRFNARRIVLGDDEVERGLGQQSMHQQVDETAQPWNADTFPMPPRAP